MKLNGNMALILHYFDEFGSVRAHCLKVVDKAITMGNSRLLSTSKRLQRNPRDATGMLYNCEVEIL